MVRTSINAGGRMVIDMLTIGVLTVVFIFVQILFYLIQTWSLRKSFGPLISRAFGILGKRSGEVRGDAALREEMLGDVLDSPKATAVKMALGALGIDVDSYLERYGPEKAITGLFEIGAMFGITPETLLSGQLGSSPQGLLSSSPGSNVENPYLRRL